MVQLRLLIALIVFLAAQTFMHAQGWEHIYPSTEVNDLTEAVWFNGDTAFVCGTSWTLLQTTDGGETWNNALNHERNLDIIRLVTDGNKVFFTGAIPKWTLIGPADTLTAVFSYDPRTGVLEDLSFSTQPMGRGIIISSKWQPPILVTDGYLYLQVWTGDPNLWRMNRQTKEWELFESGMEILSICVMDDDNVVFVGTERPGYDTRYRCLTTDGGATWTKEKAGIWTVPVTSLEMKSIPNSDALRMTVAAGQFVYYSDDTCRTWKRSKVVKLNGLYKPYIVSVTPRTADHWYVLGSEADIWETRDAGQTWLNLKDIESMSDYQFRSVHLLVVNEVGKMLLPFERGTIIQSPNGGVTWEHHLTSIMQMVTQMHFFDTRHGLMIGQDYKGEYWMYASTDGGVTWERTGTFDYSETAGWSSLDSFDEIYRYSMTMDNDNMWHFTQYRSTDQGASWVLVHESEIGEDVERFMPFEDRYVASLRSIATPPGFYVSEDRGASWTFYDAGRDEFYPIDIKAGRTAEGREDYFLIPRYPELAILYRSSDGCKTWQPIYSGSMSSKAQFKELDVISPDTIALRINDDVHITTTGRTGFEVYTHSTIPGLSRDPEEFVYFPPDVFMVKATFIVMHTDTWWTTSERQLVKSAFDDLPASSFFLDGKNGWVAYGREIWRTTNGGVNWVRSIPDVAEGLGISAVYPNPVSVGGSVSVFIQQGAYINTPLQVVVYDLLGREVALLYNGQSGDMNRIFTWNTSALNPGMYYITATAGAARSVRPIAIVR